MFISKFSFHRNIFLFYAFIFFGLFLYYILSFCCCCYVAQRQTGKMMENPRVADTEQIGRQRDVKGCKWTDRRQIVTRTKPHTFRPRHAQNTSVVRVSSQRGTHWWCTIATKRNCGMLESNTISHILPWKLNANSYGDNILSDLPVANWFEFICKLNGWVDFFFLFALLMLLLVVGGCWWCSSYPCGSIDIQDCHGMHGGFHGYMLNRERRWSRAWEQFRMNVKHLFNVVEESEQNRKKNCSTYHWMMVVSM